MDDGGPNDRKRGEPLHILFVCSMNQWRSPTAEQLYRNVAGVQVRSGGTSAKARRRVTRADIEWADLILVMERNHRARLLADHPDAIRDRILHVLDIPDDYRYMDPELITELRAAIDPILADHA